MANRALLVGINNYPGAPLNGCVNDMNDMANLLTSRYGFKSNEIRVIVNNRATAKEISLRCKWLAQCKPGDNVLFQFSGHGVQFPARNQKDEIDNLLECIAPYDFDWSRGRMLADKDLVKIFSQIPKNVKFNWISDSCHSGDLSRNMSQVIQTPRQYPVPFDMEWRMQCANELELKPDTRNMINNVLDVGFISGCKSNQTSADTVVNGRPCGALTHYFIKNLKEHDKNTPLRKIVEETNKELASLGYSQKPQVEGARKDKPFLQ
jgi:hypothetical protein